jgi:hypothetical protein
MNVQHEGLLDLWVLTRHSELDATIMSRAIRATFARRGTALPTRTPFGLSDKFAEDLTKQTHGGPSQPEKTRSAELQVIVENLRGFLESVLVHKTSGPS